MNEEKYVGLDVHQSSTVAAVHNERGKRGCFRSLLLVTCPYLILTKALVPDL
jgi:hypothetical protein